MSDFPARDVKQLLWRPAPLVVQDGLGYAAGRLGAALGPVTSEPVIYRRAEPARAGGDFKGAWCPSSAGTGYINLTPGTFRIDGTEWIPDVTGISVGAGYLNYVFLRVALSPTYEDGYCSGGGAISVSVLASASLPSSDDSYGYILLCTWQDGLAERVRWFNLAGELGGKGGGGVAFTVWYG